MNLLAAPPGGQSSGKLYFDVVGDVPNSVVYNDGVQDLLVWVPGAPVGGVPVVGPTETGTSEIIGGSELGGGGPDAVAPPVVSAPPGLAPSRSKTTSIAERKR